MRRLVHGFAVVALALALPLPPPAQAQAHTRPLAIVVHGGAGTLRREAMTPEREAAYHEALGRALDAGYEVLERGGSSLDAVVAAVRILEDAPLFNAGRGAVLNRDGEAELDAAVMDGRNREAGAVASVRTVRNPVELARLVMQQSPHVLLAGAGAEAFAAERNVTLVPNVWFRTPERERQLQDVLRRREDANAAALEPAHRFGTVGAVAIDRHGNLAAATSTGGTTAKHPGRIGDAPLIGAGTYADNAACAVSATGQGEFFIRSVAAHDICALHAYRRLSLAAAAREVVQGKLRTMGAEGGVIALDPEGNVVMEFNTSGMYRGVRTSAGRRETAIFSP
jgi:L-asparaginase / beta-aspartyl-peptidase